MIRAPHIDDASKAALELVEVVCDVGSEVCELAVLATHDAVFFISESGGAKPRGAVFLVKVPGGVKPPDRAHDFSAVVQRLFRVPAVERHAELLKIGPTIV